MKLTESRNARSEQLLVMPTELLTNGEWLPGKLLSGSEHQRYKMVLDTNINLFQPIISILLCSLFSSIITKRPCGF